MALTRRLVSVLLAAACALTAALPRAAEPLALDWTAPAGCPGRDDVLAEVRRLLGGKIATDSPLTARASVTRVAASDYHLRITLQRGEGERTREVRAPSCAELGDTAALVLAIAIDPDAVESTPPRAAPAPADPSAEAPPAPPPTGPPDASLSVPPAAVPPLLAPRAAPFVAPVFSLPAPAPPPPSLPVRSFRAYASLGAETGIFRDPAPMIRAGLAMLRAALRLDATLMLAWGGRISSLELPTKGGEFWFAGGALSTCYEAPLGRGGPRPVAVAGCGGLEGGAVVAESYGVTSPGHGEAPWLAPVAAGLLRWAFTRRAALRIELSLAVPLTRPSFWITGVGMVHEPGPVTGRAGAGVEIDL